MMNKGYKLNQIMQIPLKKTKKCFERKMKEMKEKNFYHF